MTWRMQDRLNNRDGVSGIDIVDEDTDTIVCSLPDGASRAGGHAFPEQLKRAHLLTAAPQLLDALRDLVAQCERNKVHLASDIAGRRIDLAHAMDVADILVRNLTD